jgi:DinB superfamily
MQEDAHALRIVRLRDAFTAAHERFLTRLRGAAADEAERAPADGGWSAAQIGWHVAGVTAQFAGLMTGDVPGAQPLSATYQPREWSEIAATMPAQLRAPTRVRPPDGVSRDEAVALLESAAARMRHALDVTPAGRCARFGISSPIVGGEITLYQVAEWATAHIIRHNQQAKRVLGR